MINHIPRTNFMEVAISEAIACSQFGEHPVGALIVKGSEIISHVGQTNNLLPVPLDHRKDVGPGPHLYWNAIAFFP